MRTDLEHVAINKALHDIIAILNQHWLSCADLALPTPVGRSTETQEVFDPVEEAREGTKRIVMLNEEQGDAFDRPRIVMAVDDADRTIRCFYIDGPGQLVDPKKRSSTQPIIKFVNVTTRGRID